MRPSVLALVLWTAISLLFGPIVTRGQSATGTAAPGTPDLSRRSDKELVKELLNKETRDRAFYELERRRRPDRKESFEEFQKFESNRVQDVIVCDQGAGAPPLYLVLQYGFDSFSIAPSSRDYPPANGEKLFAPAYPSIRKREGVWDLFTADGRWIERNDNYLSQGVLADINGDGFVERVDTMCYGDSDDKYFGDILTVSRVAGKEDARLLAVVTKWGGAAGRAAAIRQDAGEDEEWTFDVTDRNKDSLYEIEIGPMRAEGVDPRVVFHWDNFKMAYISSRGDAGDHFAVLTGKNLHEELKQLCEGSPFSGNGRMGKEKGKKVKGGAEYAYHTLKGLTNEEILRYMGPGKKESDKDGFNRSEPTKIPKDIWDLPPKKAALALAEANQSEDHKRNFDLAVDDSDGQGPPEKCSLLSYSGGPGCPFAGDHISGYHFLRCDPDKSYYAYAGTRYPMALALGYGGSQPVSCAVFREVAYEDARRIVEIVWWLNRIRSHNAHGYENSAMSFSTADGFGELRILLDTGEEPICENDTLWSEAVSRRWYSHYNKEVFLNIADAFIGSEVPAWLERKSLGPLKAVQELSSENEGALTEEFRTSAKRIMTLFSPDERAMSFDVIETTVQGIGERELANLKPDLEALQKRLPPRADQAFWDLKAAQEGREKTWRDKLSGQSRNITDELFRGTADSGTSAALRQDSLYEPIPETENTNYKRTGKIESIREAIGKTLMKLNGVSSPAVLEKHLENQEQFPIADAQALLKRDPQAYVRVLEKWLAKVDAVQSTKIFEEIERVAPARAVEIAVKRPGDVKDALVVPIFELLRKQGYTKNEAERVAAMLEMAADAKTPDWQVGDIVQTLVPEEEPLRYSNGRINELLLGLLNGRFNPKTDGYHIETVCWALAGRTGGKHFEKILDLWDKNQEDLRTGYCHVLGTAVYSATHGTQQQREKLAAYLEPCFGERNTPISTVLWGVWAADLRQLERHLARIATSGPDAEETQEYYSSGPTPPDFLRLSHLARKILSIWKEEDVVTRAKLLMALALDREYSMESSGDRGISEMMAKSLKNSWDSMNADQRKEIHAFPDWAGKEGKGEKADEYALSEKREAVSKLKKMLDSLGCL